MSSFTKLNQSYSLRLIGLDYYFDEMIKLYEANKFPKVLLLSGIKGVGKFTLIMHFINYIFSKNESTSYDIKKKNININSTFYNLLSNRTSQDVMFVQAEENKNIKIEDIRHLKSTISHSSLSNNPRFTIIDEVEFLNKNSVNALLKTLEEPTSNNFFILINNKQADLIETISSRCLKSNIFLNTKQKNDIINYLIDDRKIEKVIDFNNHLSPGLFLIFNEMFLKYKINENDNIFFKLNKLMNAYKKEKIKSIISLTYFLVDNYFLNEIKNNKSELEFLLNTKSSIIKTISDFVQYNLNINPVLNSIKIKLTNV
jgi:DNA polymerase-3 subunit delta'